MPNLNLVCLMGNLTRDPELKYTQNNNTAVCKFSMAINRKAKNGQDETTFVECVAWAKNAENIQKYVHKGQPLFVEGRLTLERWTAQDGSNRQKMTVTVESFQFLSERSEPQPGQHQYYDQNNSDGGF